MFVLLNKGSFYNPTKLVFAGFRMPSGVIHAAYHGMEHSQ